MVNMGDTLGVGNINLLPKGGLNLSPVITAVAIFFGIVIVGGILFAIYFNKLKKKEFKYIVNLFQDVNGKPMWVSSDKAKELKIKGTNVRLFYWEKSKIYSAYPTRAMGPNVFAYKINRFGELANFDLTNVGDVDAKIEYDHRDQTYAYLNLQTLINRNYRDKNVKWWKENLPLIVVIVSALLLGIEMWFFFSQSGHQLAQWTSISENMKDAALSIAESVKTLKGINSGAVIG